jgi:hypothetical protein
MDSSACGGAPSGPTHRPPQCIRVAFCHESWRVLSRMVARIVTNPVNLQHPHQVTLTTPNRTKNYEIKQGTLAGNH